MWFIKRKRGPSKEEEDSMRITFIQRKAREMGISDTWRLSKTDLVKAIQRKEGYFDCFGSAVDYCDQANCTWKRDCLGK